MSEKLLTPLQAIRKACLECVCGSANEVKLCTMGERCALFPYRFGKRPATAERQAAKRAAKKAAEAAGGRE